MKTPRICEHEEKYIISILETCPVPVFMAPRVVGKKITRYLNTKKACAKCSKKK